jgi:signal transduction histidine kinase
VLTAHEGERKRIARELHDDTAQALTSILIRLRLLEKTAEDEGVRRNVGELRELTSNALDSVRRMAVDLRPRLWTTGLVRRFILTQISTRILAHQRDLLAEGSKTPARQRRRTIPYSSRGVDERR